MCYRGKRGHWGCTSEVIMLTELELLGRGGGSVKDCLRTMAIICSLYGPIGLNTVLRFSDKHKMLLIIVYHYY